MLDVKTGSGAFMARARGRRALARALVEVAGGAGLPTVALLTDMDEVLGTTAGNALEVRESIDHLTGAAREPRLHEVTVALAAAALVAVRGWRRATRTAREAVQRALDDGSAAERFGAMVAALGGPADLVENPDEHLPQRAGHAPGDPGAPGLRRRRSTPARSASSSPCLGGNRRREDDADRLRGRALARSRRSAPRSAPTGRSRSSTRAATRAPRKPPPRCGAPSSVGAGGAAERPRAPGPRGRRLPLAELHVHLEGTAPPDLIRRIAARNGLRFPRGCSHRDDRFAWVDFLDFLRTYDLAASVIRTAEDYRDVTYEYLMSLRRRGRDLRRADRLARPRGIRRPARRRALRRDRSGHRRRARATAASRRASSSSAVRNFGVEAAEAIARRHAEERHPYVVGFNLAGDEAGYPPGQFAKAYAIAGGIRPRLHRARRRARRRRSPCARR